METTARKRLLLLSTGILSEGLRLPALNPGLFAVVFALAVANATVYVLMYSVSVQPMATTIMFDGAGALWDVDPASFDVDFEHGFLVEHMGRRRLWRLAPPVAVFVVCNAVVGSVVWVIAVFASVAVCSGKAPRTFGELLHMARSPLVVAAVANIAGTACVGAIAASALTLAMVFLHLHERLPSALVLVDVVFVCAVYAAHRCVDFVCAVGVVVAAEEPGCDGAAAALRHAWRLAAMEPAEAVSFVLAMPAVAGAASPFFVVAAAASAPASVGWCALLGLVYVVVSGAAQVVSVCAITLFYYECRLRCKEADSLHSDEPHV